MNYNDLKAPRFNPRKYRKIFVHQDLHKQWKEKTGRRDVPYSVFRGIWEMIADGIISTVQVERDGVRLDAGLGDLYIGYTILKGDKKAVDYKLSQEHGKTIYHDNWHTNGKTANIVYGTSNRKYIYKKRKIWSFDPSRDFARQVSQSARLYPDRYKNSQERIFNPSLAKLTITNNTDGED